MNGLRHRTARILGALLGLGTLAWLLTRRREPTDAGARQVASVPEDESAPVREHDKLTPAPRHEFVRRWLRPLAALAIVLIVASVLLWPEGFTADDLEPPTGGVLILVEATEEVTLTVQANIVEADTPGLALLVLDLTAVDKRPGFHAHLVASGQYRLAGDIEGACLSRYRVPDDETNACSAEPFGVRNLDYRPDGAFGVVLDGEIHHVSDFPAYDKATATAVSGDSVGGAARFEIPFVLPEPARIGVSEYRSFAPIGISNDRPPTPRGPTDPYSRPAEGYVDLATGTALRMARIERLKFAPESPVGPWQLQWSSPAPDRADRLVWTSGPVGLGRVSYQTVDPFAQNTLSQRGFLAGVAISLASATILLLVEQYLAHRRVRTRARRHNPRR